MKNQAEAGSEEEVRRTTEIEELTDQILNNDNKAETEISSIENEIEELKNQKTISTEDTEEALNERITSLENEIKEIKKDTLNSIKKSTKKK